MLKQDWSQLPITAQQLGVFGEHYARALLALKGIRAYAPDVDDHGIDLLVETDSRILKLQIKTVRVKSGYVSLKKRDFDTKDSCVYLLLILLIDGQEPGLYLIPSAAWDRANKSCLVFHAYQEPEYGVNISAKNLEQLEEFRFRIGASLF